MTNLPVTPAPVKEIWNEQKAKLIAKFPVLTEADLLFEEGKKDEMLTKVSAKLGKTKEELSAILLTL
jgi:hypothetical protein